MKITFKKDHLNYKSGKDYEVENGTAEYLIRVGVAVKAKKEADKKAKK